MLVSVPPPLPLLPPAGVWPLCPSWCWGPYQGPSSALTLMHYTLCFFWENGHNFNMFTPLYSLKFGPLGLPSLSSLCPMEKKREAFLLLWQSLCCPFSHRLAGTGNTIVHGYRRDFDPTKIPSLLIWMWHSAPRLMVLGPGIHQSNFRRIFHEHESTVKNIKVDTSPPLTLNKESGHLVS